MTANGRSVPQKQCGRPNFARINPCNEAFSQERAHYAPSSEMRNTGFRALGGYMKYRTAFFLTAAMALSLSAGVAKADRLVEEYNAYIGEEDLYNSHGEQLTEPWQVIRQDRANYHRYGVTQPGDEGDSFFASAKNREKAERMIEYGTIETRAARALLRGGSVINVQIFRGAEGDYINVTVD